MDWGHRALVSVLPIARPGTGDAGAAQFLGQRHGHGRQGALGRVVLRLAGARPQPSAWELLSLRSLGIAVGKPAVAVVKASAITLLPPASPYRFTARNQLAGTVANVAKGAINSQVVIALKGGSSLSAVVTNDAIGELDLKVGAPITALFKAGQVLLGVPA